MSVEQIWNFDVLFPYVTLTVLMKMREFGSVEGKLGAETEFGFSFVREIMVSWFDDV